MRISRDVWGNIYEEHEYPKKLRELKSYEQKTPQPDRLECGYYHYSNRDSQGALLRDTRNFPDIIDTRKYKILADGYFDRIQSWHPEGYKKAFELIKGNWYINQLQTLSDDMIKQFAQILFELEDKPEHVRIIYYYNVATGYDCPYIVTISKVKSEEN